MHLSENREIYPWYIDVINRLGKTFVASFAKLYTERHCVQVVHSLVHISDTIHDYGPVHTFTTFQFENELGKSRKLFFALKELPYSLGLLTRITKGTRRHAQEIINNLHIIQEAYCHLNDLALTHNDFGEYLSSRFTNYKVNNLSQDCRLGHASKKEDSLVQLLFPLTKVKCYQTIHLGKLRLCTRTYAEGKVADDSNIIFVLDRVQRPGKIRAIFTIDDGEPHLLMAYITVLSPFTCQIDENENFTYHNILSSTNSTWQYVPIRLEAFVEKSIFFRSVGGVSYFLRQPTLDHCS
ncbi:unnamed protein product [Adineta steineri]|uniref:Uncharacterized protein n=1 Tax=Adineta steineri TaxID=433720 RepID=A0A820B7N0_9BILA|nr:unnamed protein product [Adineta steineri]CAF4188162.1 unnamed protein product [Adineta steineri]